MLKQIIKGLMPPYALRLANYLYGHMVVQKNNNVHGRPIPWSRGYSAYKSKIIKGALSGCSYDDCDFLTENYGIGVDERCVEYPWLFSHIPDSAKKILDAGSVLNHEYLLDSKILKEKKLDILSLAPENQAFWRRGISYLYADLRDIPIKDCYYDAIVCLSTLEHIGCDNTNYVNNSDYKEDRPEDFASVMKELNRVLKPGGELYISVPFGSYRHFGAFQQFDSALLSKAVDAFGDAKNISKAYYRYTEHGWREDSEENCASSNYVEWLADSYIKGQLPSKIPVEEDMAAAARAVACIKIVK